MSITAFASAVAGMLVLCVTGLSSNSGQARPNTRDCHTQHLNRQPDQSQMSSPHAIAGNCRTPYFLQRERGLGR